MNELKARKEDITEFYDILEEIGSGQFAVVKKVIEKETGTKYAAKFMKKKRTKSRRARGVTVEQITQEAGVLRDVRHEGVIYLHDVFEAAQEYVLVLELLSGGELFEFLSEQEYLTEAEAIGFARQVVDAVNYLHEKHIVHLDIKPENIVLKTRSSNQVKLIDFGLARIITPGETVKEIMGTPEFVAPEIIAFEGIGTPTDMWAVGVLAYILVSGASPFLGDSDHETYANITNVDYDFDDEYFKGISSQAKEFVSSLLIKDPRARLTSSECLQHPWLQLEADLLRRRSTVIKTDSFKEFTAKARWKKTLKKVIAVNRMALLGKKDGPAAKNILFESDLSTTSDSDTETPHETCDHTYHNQLCSVSSESRAKLNAELDNNNGLACAHIKPPPPPPSSGRTQIQSNTRSEHDLRREDCNEETANVKSGQNGVEDDNSVAPVDLGKHSIGEAAAPSQTRSELELNEPALVAKSEALAGNGLTKGRNLTGESEHLEGASTEKQVEWDNLQSTDSGTRRAPEKEVAEGDIQSAVSATANAPEKGLPVTSGIPSTDSASALDKELVESGNLQGTDYTTGSPLEKGLIKSGNIGNADFQQGVPAST